MSHDKCSGLSQGSISFSVKGQIGSKNFRICYPNIASVNILCFVFFFITFKSVKTILSLGAVQRRISIISQLKKKKDVRWTWFTAIVYQTLVYLLLKLEIWLFDSMVFDSMVIYRCVTKFPHTQ